MAHPYEGLPPGAYWKTGVAARSPLDPGALYTRRFAIARRAPVVTAGSCFAQHVGRVLRGAGYNVVDREPFPAPLAPARATTSPT